MGKASVKQSLLKDNGESLISNDSEAETVAGAIFSDAEDLVSTVQEKGYQEALDTVSSIQEGLDALKQYLEDKE